MSIRLAQSEDYLEAEHQSE